MPETSTKAQCQNCSKIYDEDDLDTIEHYSMRVSAGEVVPAGQCPDPDCGALCHLVNSGESIATPAPSRQRASRTR